MVGSHARRSRWWRARAALVGVSVLASLTPGAFAANNPNITITSFSPASGTVGTTVTISGSNLSAVTSIIFPNGAETFPTSVTSTTLVTAVPADASGAGVIVLSNGKKTIPSSSTFVVPPTISGISPTSGAANSTVITITGTGLATLTGVSFTSTAAASFGVNSNTSAWAIAPDLGSKPQKKSTLTVTTPGGSATSTQAFSQTSIGTAPSSVFTASEVAIGGRHACVRRSDGTAWCWGSGSVGALGNGAVKDSLHPVQVLSSGVEGGIGDDTPLPLTDVLQVVSGSDSSCARLSSGEVVCWGSNFYGQLGDGTTTDSSNPVRVLASGDEGNSPVPLTGVASIAAGSNHVCAVKTDGAVVCWGDNGYGQLGDGGTTSASNPVSVIGIGGVGTLGAVTSTSAGDTHTCALLTTGQAACWGKNGYGQLGDGNTTDSLSPVRVLAANGVALGGITEVSVFGYESTCVRRSTASGSVWCWGLGGDGELGDGTATSRVTPTQVLAADGSPLSLVTDIATGYYHACAVRSDGTAWCWGYNGNGQVGDGTTTEADRASQVLATGTPTSAPVPLTGVVRLWTGGYSDTSCAILADGGSNVRCWGKNGDGQTGDGVVDDSDRLNPVGVRPRPYLEVRSITAGAYYSCAVRTDGAVLCWGRNTYGNLGDGTTADRSRPVFVLRSGTDQFGDPRFTDALAVSAGYGTACALTTTGGVWCWGFGDEGRLGNGSSTPSNWPVRVTMTGGSPLSGVTAIASGSSHTCAIRSDGSVWCWGSNDNGQLGDGTTDDRDRATRVVAVGGTGSLSGVTTISAGDNHTCAIRKSGGGSLVCWGRDNSGQLGDGDSVADGVSSLYRAAPYPVAGLSGSGTLSGVTTVAAIHNHTCAIRKGAVLCWGSNSDGQLGDGTTDDRDYPMSVQGVGGVGSLSGATAVTGGYAFTCARLGTGRIACWGYNDYGNLGDGTLLSREYPEYVLSAGTVADGDSVPFSGATALAASPYAVHVCALVGSRVTCWGGDEEGAIGAADGGDVRYPFATFGTYDLWS